MRGDIRGAYRILIGNPEIEELFGRPRTRREDNIKRYGLMGCHTM
jgi:hypothetical protein